MGKKLRFLLLGRSPEGATGWPHPATITVHPDRAATRLNFSLGPHIVNVGGQAGVADVIVGGAFNETYAEPFDATQSRWLIPYLVRLAACEPVQEEELVAAYVDRLGSRPAVEPAERYGS